MWKRSLLKWWWPQCSFCWLHVLFPTQRVHPGVWLHSACSHLSTQQYQLQTTSAVVTDLPRKDLKWLMLVNIRILLLYLSPNFSANKILPECNWKIKWRCESCLQDYSKWRHFVSGYVMQTEIAGLHRQNPHEPLQAAPDMAVLMQIVLLIWDLTPITGAVYSFQGVRQKIIIPIY